MFIKKRNRKKKENEWSNFYYDWETFKNMSSL